MIGKKISPILSEIEDTLLEFEINKGGKPGYTTEGFRAAIKIFMSALMDRMWKLQYDEKMDINDRLKMVKKAGEDVRKLVKTYTDIDTYDFFSNN